MEQVTKHVTLTILKHFNVTPRTSLDQAETSEGRGYQLRFANKLPSIIFTDNKIKDKSNESVKIVLVDTIRKEPVTSGPLSSIKIQILVLDGDFGCEAQENWTEQEFNAKVVHEREGKRPLLTGELNIMLRDGVGIINDLSFTDNSIWIRCRKFRLGARVVQSIGGQVSIKEAISEAFMVKDHRAEVYKKHCPPSLDDKVWRLEKIRKDGKFHQRLASHQIDTVKDFMRMYVTDPITLRKMLNCPKGAWDKIVEHASTCAVVDEKFYAYSVEGIGLLFNSIYMLVAATFDGHNYQYLDKLSVVQKSSVESIKEQAYKNVNNFDPIDGLAIFGPSKSLTSLQDEPISGSTTGLQRPEFPVAEQGSAEMQIDCHHATASSFYMGGSENHSHQLQLPVAENTHLIQEFDPIFGNYNFRMDEFFSPFNGETVPNLASEMTSQAPMSTWPPVNATWEHINGFNQPSTMNDSEFAHDANTHGMQQAVDPMSTRSPLSATWGNSYGMFMPISNNFESASLLNTDVATRYYTRPNGNRICPVFTIGWYLYVKAKGVRVGDQLIFSGCQVVGADGELEMRYKIRVTRPGPVTFNGEPVPLDVEYLA
ncbi:hypothetical protein QYF36_014740 [Acer negundo]|nr:hypothetical protein QYF36_014740 [Acer negundo]